MRDIPRSALEELDWASEERPQSLSTVFAHAVGLARGAEEWYAGKRRNMRRGGRVLRVCAILLGALAAIIPVLAQIIGEDGSQSGIAPAWATVALAGAATLVALDRFFGFTAAWTRFMAAELEISRLRHDFEYEWQKLLVMLPSDPSDDHAIVLIDRARQLVLAVDDAVVTETGAWVVEFRDLLKSAEAALEASKTQ